MQGRTSAWWLAWWRARRRVGNGNINQSYRKKSAKTCAIRKMSKLKKHKLFRSRKFLLELRQNKGSRVQALVIGFHCWIIHEAIIIHLIQQLYCDEHVCSVFFLHVEVKIILSSIRFLTNSFIKWIFFLQSTIFRGDHFLSGDQILCRLLYWCLGIL